VRLAYCLANHLIICLNKAKAEIECIEQGDKIKKQTDIDGHGSRPSSDNCQPPNPLHFSFFTTFKKALKNMMVIENNYLILFSTFKFIFTSSFLVPKFLLRTCSFVLGTGSYHYRYVFSIP
jgi:hypothetical protein